MLNKALRILLTMDGLILLAGAMSGPIYALFVEDIGGDLMDASLSGGFFAFAAGITTLVAGKFSDKIKENELIIVFAYALMGLGFLLMTQVQTIGALFAVQALIGFAGATYAPAFDAIYSKNLKRGHAGQCWGAYASVDYFTTGIGAILGGVVVFYFSFDTMFLLMSVICFFGAGYIYFLPRKIL